MNLNRLDDFRDEAASSIKMYCPVRDERILLPLFLEYHRSLGIRCFVFVDNGSTDGTLEYLLEQPDCIVYLTHDSYAEARYAADWISELVRRHSLGEWALYLDCDELLVYEGCETVSIYEFVDQFKEVGCDSFMGIMLDVYSSQAKGVIELSSFDDFKKKEFFLDSDYLFRVFPKKPWAKCRRSVEVIGGPRCRLFSDVDSDSKRGWFYYFLAGQVNRFIDYVPMSWMPSLARVWPRSSFAQHKNPLNKIGENFSYGHSHGSSNASCAPYAFGILHLKFSQELTQKLDPVFSYNNHYNRGLSRFRLRGALELHKDQPFVYERSVRYEGSETLVKHSLIGSGPASVWLNQVDYFRSDYHAGEEQS